jgi:hypothetical protein
MNTSLTTDELEFLKKLQSFPDKEGIIVHKPVEVTIKKLNPLINKGYVKLSAAVCGPLLVKTGETIVKLTEAGEIAMSTSPS